MSRGGAAPRLAFASFLLWALGTAPGAAHKTSLAHVTVEGGPDAEVTLLLSTHDLAAALGLPFDPAAPVPFAVVDGARPAILAYLDERLALRASDRSCAAGPTRIAEIRPGEELRVQRAFACPPGTADLTLSYRLFFDIDGGHRAIVEGGGR